MNARRIEAPQLDMGSLLRAAAILDRWPLPRVSQALDTLTEKILADDNQHTRGLAESLAMIRSQQCGADLRTIRLTDPERKDGVRPRSRRDVRRFATLAKLEIALTQRAAPLARIAPPRLQSIPTATQTDLF
jgi:hypothetical protein